MCADCISGKKPKPGRYVSKLLLFKDLKQAGYPLKPDDLTIDEWLDLNKIDFELTHIFKSKK